MINKEQKLRIAAVVKESVVDGPGLRYVIFTQGCPHQCKGCHNPDSHDFKGGYEISINELLQEINNEKLIDGITFSGGEPFAQPEACAALAWLVKKANPKLNILAYSGYHHNDLVQQAKSNNAIDSFLKSLDILIDGPYEEDKKNPKLPFRGSDNQNIIYLNN